MRVPEPTDRKEYTLTLGQLVGWFFGPGLTLVGVIIWVVTRLVTLQEHDAARAAESAKQAETLGKIQETLTTVRIQLAASLPKSQPPTQQP